MRPTQEAKFLAIASTTNLRDAFFRILVLKRGYLIIAVLVVTMHAISQLFFAQRAS